jgi:hypothetical protein
MSGPARAAGLGELQQFLENGFDTFRAMKGSQEFISIVELRERAIASSLFQANAVNAAAGSADNRALACLPSTSLAS